MKTYRITYIVKKCIQCPNTDDTDEILDKAMEDIFKIVCTLFKVSRVSADEVYKLFLEKRNINVKRQEVGYAEV